MAWCWYIEGGSFYGGYASRQEAVNAAYANDEDRERVCVGATSDPIDEMARLVDARSLAEQLEGWLNVDDCRVSVGTDAQAALEAWVREHLDFDAHVVCLDGDEPTAHEWALAATAYAESRHG